MTAAARVVETHISILFFVDGKVYKLRKPVEFGFLDFRLRAKRQVDCEREVVLNSRLAPDVYLGVADLTIAGEAFDHMVVMRELPDECRLATLAYRGDPLTSPIVEIARTLATFHRNAGKISRNRCRRFAGVVARCVGGQLQRGVSVRRDVVGRPHRIRDPSPGPKVVGRPHTPFEFSHRVGLYL